METRLRVGLGMDCHRLQEGLPLILAGQHIESSTHGPVAHSDGDVLCHALIDALLGACALGDIGEHFPPSDEQWRGASGERLLKKTLHVISTHYPHWQLLNIDATLSLEKPKLKHYKQAIQQQLAAWLGLAPKCVGLKAKTGEGLAPVGTLEAIEAHVVVLLLLETNPIV
jgi:2-C-methyl-D-erythritol 2,4-cyclodiphosphate synthase